MRKSKILIQLFSVLVLLTASSGCRMFDMLDMPKKLDQTNDKMTDMSRKMDGINDTKEAVRKQKLMYALDHMLSADNTENFSPAPTMMMPWGKEFAESATVEEIVQLTENMLIDVNDIDYNATSDADKEKADHKRIARLMIVQLLAGFMPDATVHAMVNEQIVNAGPYKDEALSLLLYRISFIDNVLVRAELLGRESVSVGRIAKAIEYAQKADEVASLSPDITSQIFVKISTANFYDKDFAENLSARYNATAVLDLWKFIRGAIDTKVIRKDGQDARLDQLKQVVDARIAHWLG